MVIFRAMRTSDFNYQLPEELIAQYPLQKRTASRLLHVKGGSFKDGMFNDLLTLVGPGDLMIFNDTRVIPARLHGHKHSGGKVEVLIERILDEHRVLAHIRASKSPRTGSKLLLEDKVNAEMLGRHGELFELEFKSVQTVLQLLEQYGHMPLPPYIERADELADQQRYQTVYAERPGAVAAPTAGLHFDEAMLDKLKQAGVESGFVTLHVGAGTFQPVRVDDIKHHHMHSEYLEVSETVVKQIEHTRSRGGRVIAVGTTAVRSLETAAQEGKLAPYRGETTIFIYPGYKFQVIDALVTNFHLPQSTLLMLVSALGGHQNIMQAYQHAVAMEYRFFSYGDAMFIEKSA